MTAKKQVSTSRKNAVRKVSKPKSGHGKDLWSTKDIQEKLGISERSARNFLGSIPIAEHRDKFNWYDPSKVTAAWKSKAEKNKATEGTKEWYEVEKLKRQIGKLEVELEAMKGRYIPKDDVYTSFLSMALQFRKHLTEQVEKLPPLMAGLAPSGMQVKLRDYNEEIISKCRDHKWSPTDKGL